MASPVVVRRVGRPTKTGKAIELYMVSIAEDIIDQQAQQSMNATGDSANSHKVTISRDPDQGIHEAAGYYTFLVKDQGRAEKSKPPPGNVIEKWLSDRGIQLREGRTLAQVVYLVQRKIGALGTAITEGEKGIDTELAVNKHLQTYIEAVGDEHAKQVSQSILNSFKRIPGAKVKTNVKR